MKLFWKYRILFFFLLVFFASCNDNALNNNKHELLIKSTKISLVSKTEKINLLNKSKPIVITSYMEQSLIDIGLVEIHTIDSTIVVDLKYSSCDNFLGFDVYGEFNKCYLQPDVANKLKKSQTFLKLIFPYYNIIVFDAVRPRSIQYKMWDTINIPKSERTKYLSNPEYGSLHNFGAAVDVSIIDENGIELDMGTKYDFFGELAYPREEWRMLKEGKLFQNQLLNRELLRNVMKNGGFSGITTEWWHFNSCNRKQAYAKYKIIE